MTQLPASFETLTFGRAFIYSLDRPIRPESFFRIRFVGAGQRATTGKWKIGTTFGEKESLRATWFLRIAGVIKADGIGIGVLGKLRCKLAIWDNREMEISNVAISLQGVELEELEDKLDLNCR